MAEAVEKAYQAIRDGIMRGVYPQGAHITAQELAATAGLSRTPVREAMRRLHSEGLIQIIPNRGAFVSSWSEVEVDQYFDVVVLLESHAVELATTQITDEQIATLRGLAEEMWALVKTDQPPVERLKENNDTFHMTIIGACNNPRLRDLLRSMVEVEYVLGTFLRYNHEELVRSAHQHTELVSAFEARDPIWARSVMATHLLSARHAVLRSLHEAV